MPVLESIQVSGCTLREVKAARDIIRESEDEVLNHFNKFVRMLRQNHSMQR